MVTVEGVEIEMVERGTGRPVRWLHGEDGLCLWLQRGFSVASACCAYGSSAASGVLSWGGGQQGQGHAVGSAGRWGVNVACPSSTGPRAIRCAFRDAVNPLGLEVRAGLHTGECELMGDDVGGIAVHTGARVAAEAAPSEVLVSSTVKDLVAGAGLRFADRGTRTLQGVPGEWRLFAVQS